LRLSPLRRGLAIDSTVDIFTFYVPHRHVYGEQWIKFMKDGVNATPLPTRSEERFSRNAETDIVCRLLLEKKKNNWHQHRPTLLLIRPILVFSSLLFLRPPPPSTSSLFPYTTLFRSLRLSPLRRGLAIDSTVDIFTFYVPHRHVYGEQWIKFMKDGVNATPLPT